LKARQIGASTIVRAYFTWKALMSEEPLRLGIMSYTHESAQYLHSLDKTFVEGLPSAMRRPLDSSTSRTIKLKDSGAELRSFTSGMKGGGTRSYALSDLHLSEFAHYDDQEEVLSNAVSTVGEGGQIVIETTANGPGDKYHQMVVGCPGNGWTLFWSPWYEHTAYAKQARFGLSNVSVMTQEERIINIDNSLFQVSDNIFFVDNNESIFNSHLYAPFKRIVNHLYDTFWSNLLVIWLMTITLCLTLYFNFFARIIKLTGKSLGIIGSSKPKKYV
jgi:hypothetical protein